MLAHSNPRNLGRDALTAAAKGRYAFVQEPGPGVMRIRAALTGVRPTQSHVVESAVPTTDVYNEPRSTVERRLGFASVEAELLDSVSDQRLFAVVARRDAKRGAAGSLTKWGHIETIIDAWAEAFRSQLDTWQRAAAPADPIPTE